MKNKASLVLLEQLVMILVFSLAAALCLRAFAWADGTSREIRQRDEAVILCQNTAETIKAEKNLEKAAELLGAARRDDHWILEEDAVLLELKSLQSVVPGMGLAEIRAVSRDTAEVLFSLTVGWQEVAQ